MIRLGPFAMANLHTFAVTGPVRMVGQAPRARALVQHRDAADEGNQADKGVAFAASYGCLARFTPHHILSLGTGPNQSFLWSCMSDFHRSAGR